MNFAAFRAGQEPFKLRFYVGHDGSMIRLISALGLGEAQQLRWPSLGSELVMEVRPCLRIYAEAWGLMWVCRSGRSRASVLSGRYMMGMRSRRWRGCRWTASLTSSIRRFRRMCLGSVILRRKLSMIRARPCEDNSEIINTTARMHLCPLHTETDKII